MLWKNIPNRLNNDKLIKNVSKVLRGAIDCAFAGVLGWVKTLIGAGSSVVKRSIRAFKMRACAADSPLVVSVNTPCEASIDTTNAPPALNSGACICARNWNAGPIGLIALADTSLKNGFLALTGKVPFSANTLVD